MEAWKKPQIYLGCIVTEAGTDSSRSLGLGPTSVTYDQVTKSVASKCQCCTSKNSLSFYETCCQFKKKWGNYWREVKYCTQLHKTKGTADQARM